MSNTSPALEMLHWREAKKAELAARQAALDPTAGYIESLVASGVSLTNFTHFNAQVDCGCPAEDGIYEQF